MRGIGTALLALALTAVACGEASGPAATTGATSTTATPTTSSPTTMPPVTTERPTTTTTPTDPDQRILVVRREGGLVPPSFLFSQLPLYTVYADGRLVYEAPRTAEFPGPLIPPVAQADLGAEGLARVMAAIEEVGLPDIRELYNTDAADQVADAPNTVAVYFDENGEHLYSVYALEIAEPTDPQARELGDLVDLLGRLAATSPDAGPFEIERLQVVAASQTADPSDPQAVVVPWPLSITPQDMQETRYGVRCVVVDVAQDPGALPAFETAHQMTFFEHDGTPYRLTVVPLLPGEVGCDPEDR